MFKICEYRDDQYYQMLALDDFDEALVQAFATAATGTAMAVVVTYEDKVVVTFPASTAALVLEHVTKGIIPGYLSTKGVSSGSHREDS